MADPIQKPQSEAQAYIARLESTLDELADLVGASLGSADPDTIRRRVKDIRTERDTAQARAKELEAEMAALKSGPVVLKVDAETSAKLKEALSNLSSAGIVVEPARDYDAEIRAARIDALKTLGVNPYDPPVCVIGAAKKRAKTLEHAQKFEDELAQIWELWGAGRPMTPGCVYEAAEEMERTATALRVKLGAIAEKLNDARIPTHYGRDQKGGPVPLPERVGLLIDSHESARMLAETWESSSMREAVERMDAAAVLSDLGAPSHAGAIHLTTAAQILALPGLLRQD